MSITQIFLVYDLSWLVLKWVETCDGLFSRISNTKVSVDEILLKKGQVP